MMRDAHPCVVIFSREVLFGAALTSLLESTREVTVCQELLPAGGTVSVSAITAEAFSNVDALVYVASDAVIAELEVAALSVIGAPILVVAHTALITEISGLLNAGATGVLRRDAEPAELLRAVEEVIAGRPFACWRTLRNVFAHIRVPLGKGHTHAAWEQNLTPREREVVRRLTAGMSNGEIAAALHLSEATVKATLSRVMTKWNVRDRLQVALRAVGT